MSIEQLIKTRQSIRKYDEKDIPNDVLKKILDAAYYAPSWMNSQPWKFILVKNPAKKALLSEASGHQPHVKAAPAVICCVADKNGWSKSEFGGVLRARGMKDEGIEKIFQVPKFYPPLLGEDKVLLRSVEQVTYAVSFMILQAKELGVETCVIGAVTNEATVVEPELIEKVNKALNLSDGQVLITMLTLGYCQNQPELHKSRKDYDKVIHFESIGQKFEV